MHASSNAIRIGFFNFTLYEKHKKGKSSCNDFL